MFNYIQLINVNAHIGSSKQCWITLTSRFIFGFRKGITLINVGYTSFHLRRSVLFVKKVVSKGGIIIINSLYCKTHIGLINRFYNIGQIVAPDDWIGGYLSNFRNLKKKVVSKRKSRSFVSALINLNFNIDNSFISSEARNINIPIISIFDTNSKSSLFDFPIPTNNKNSSVRSFYAFLFSSAVFSGLIKKIMRCKNRCSKSYVVRTRLFKKINVNFVNPNIYNSFSYFSKHKNFYTSRYKNIYINIFISRSIKYAYIRFVKIYKEFLNKNFINFKYKLVSRENILSSLDWINVFFSSIKIENIFFRLKNIFSIFRVDNIINSKNRKIRKLKKILRIFSKISRIRPYKFAAVKYVKNFNRRILKPKYGYLGCFPTYNTGITDFSRTYGVNESLVLEQDKFTLRFPFRFKFGFGKRILITKRFLKVIRLHKRVIIKKIFFKMIVKSRNIIKINQSFKKKAKIFFRIKKIIKKKIILRDKNSRIKIPKFLFKRRIIVKKKFRKIFIFTKKVNHKKRRKKNFLFIKIRKQRIKNVGRWNRTAAISFSGLYSTIELSRFVII